MHRLPAQPAIAPPGRPAGAPGPGRVGARGGARRKSQKSGFIADLDIQGWVTRVQWSPSYLGFLIYVASVISARVPLGTEGMALALVGLPWEKQKIRIDAPLVFLLAFAAWCVMGWGMTPYPDVVWDALIQLGKVVAIFFVAINVLNSHARLRLCGAVILGSFMAYPARGSILNWVTGAWTVFGRAVWNQIYANPNSLATLTLPALAMTLYLGSREKHPVYKLGSVACAGICLFIIVITQSRAAVLGMLVFGAIAFSAQRKKLRTVLIGAFVMLCVVVLVPSDTFDRALSITSTDTEHLEELDDSGSALGRYQTWMVARIIIAERPITGYGLNSYERIHAEHTVGRTDLERGARGTRDAHSTYLSLAATVGIPGLLLFLLFIGVVFAKSQKARKYVRRFDPGQAAGIRYLQAALAAWMVNAVFGTYDLIAHLYLLIAFLLASARVIESEVREKQRLRKRMARAQKGRQFRAVVG